MHCLFVWVLYYIAVGIVACIAVIMVGAISCIMIEETADLIKDVIDTNEQMKK